MSYNVLLLIPGQVKKFSLSITFINVLGVYLKQHPFIYWIRSIFGLSLFILSYVLCLNGFKMSVYHNSSYFLLCTFNISLESLRMLISFLSKMAIQSSSHIWTKEIREALWRPSNICSCFACRMRLFDNGMCTVCVSDIVELFGNCTMGTLYVSFISVITNWYSVRK